ncbi:MAG: hypothetical protein LBQ12_08305 [Deltaproteobacteria bacterium]|jgi:hypothetical protein|nr:hypothetical protein [Deltaproteobacteria bacterium]
MSGKRGVPVGALAAAGAILALLIAVLAMSKDGGGDRPEARPASPAVSDSRYGSYSSSALGHEALYEVLKEHRPHVERRLSGAPLPTGPFSAVVLADSAAFAENGSSDFQKLRNSKGRVLAVLPKWVARLDSLHNGWIREARPMFAPPDYVLFLLLRMGEDDDWDDRSSPPILTADSAQTFNLNELDVQPDFGGRPVQLLKPTPGLRPVVSSRDGVLVGEISRPGLPRSWSVSDPDRPSNHGIVRGQNLKFSLKLVDLWAAGLPRTATVTFDESHLKRTGEVRGGGGGFFKLMQSPETGPILLAFLAALLLLLFGMKRMWPEERKPERGFGKAGLIANTALILERGPLRRDLFRRYMDSVVGSAARRLKAPPAARNDPKALVDWLDARSPGKGAWRLKKIAAGAELELSLPSPSAPRLLFYAGRLHLWKEEAEIGPGTGGKDNGRGPRRGV